MKSKRRFGLVAAVAAFALGAVAASSASAHQFKAAEYPAVVTAEGGTQTFEIGGAKGVCKSVTSKTGEEGAPNLIAASATLQVHPKYKECHVTLNETQIPVKTVTTGCNYVFHAAAPSSKEGTLDVQCATGKEVKIEFEGTFAGCVWSIPGQTGLKSVDYKNEPSSNVTINAALTGIKWKATSVCGIALEGNAMTYTGSAVAKGTSGGFPDALSIE